MERYGERRRWVNEAEALGQVADSKEVRLSIMARVNAGEITLEQGQRELAAIKRNAKKNGKMTRNQAYKGKVLA